MKNIDPKNLFFIVAVLMIFYFLFNGKPTEKFNVVKISRGKLVTTPKTTTSAPKMTTLVPTTTTTTPISLVPTTTTTTPISLVQDSSYSCNDNSGAYRYIKGKLYGYPNPTIASQWDTNWGNGAIINCNNVSKSSLNLSTYPTTCDEAKATYHILFPDVKAAGADAWSHYMMYGKNEGRPWYGPTCDITTTTTPTTPIPTYSQTSTGIWLNDKFACPGAINRNTTGNNGDWNNFCIFTNVNDVQNYCNTDSQCIGYGALGGQYQATRVQPVESAVNGTFFKKISTTN